MGQTLKNEMIAMLNNIATNLNTLRELIDALPADVKESGSGSSEPGMSGSSG